MEFGTLGRRCSMDGCRQHDYLPFICEACDKVHARGTRRIEDRAHRTDNSARNTHRTLTHIHSPLSQVHCSDHRSVWAHDCKGDLSKIVTPDAPPPRPAAAAGGTSRNTKKPKKRRCKAKGCKAKGTFVVSMECKHCCAFFCVSHRFPDQHDCQGSNLDNLGGGGIAAAMSAMGASGAGGAMGASGAAAMARFAGAASTPAAASTATATVVASPVAAVACHAAARSAGSGGSGDIGGEGGGSGGGRPVGIEADADLLGRLLEMGFSRVQASTALEAAANDADRAVELLMMA